MRLIVKGVNALKATLDQLPPGVHVAWRRPGMLKQIGTEPGELALPPGKVVNEIETYCEELDVQLQAAR